MSHLCTFTLYLLGCSHPCSSHNPLVSFVSFVHVVWPRVFAFGYLQVTSLHDAELIPVLSFHEKQLVSHLPTRHSTGSCFAPSFLLCFLYVLQHPAPTYHPETPPFNLTHPPDPINDPPQYSKRVRQIKTSLLAIK